MISCKPLIFYSRKPTSTILLPAIKYEIKKSRFQSKIKSINNSLIQNVIEFYEPIGKGIQDRKPV